MMKRIELLQTALQTASPETSALILRFIEANSAENVKLNLFDFVADKKRYGDVHKGVTYKNGFAYATDAYILLRVPRSYPAENDGKALDQNGKELEYSVDYDRYLPSEGATIAVDLSEIHRAEIMYKALKKEGKVAFKRVGSHCYSIHLLAKFRKAAKAIKFDRYFETPDHLCAEKWDGSRVVLMRVNVQGEAIIL